jgi:predicted permease
LFLRTFVSLTSVPLGFDPAPLLVVSVSGLKAGAAPADRLALYEGARDAAAAVPGVGSAGLSIISPVSGQGWNTDIIEPLIAATDRRDRMSWVNAVSPGWFATYGIPMRAGDDFTTRDRAGSPLVTIVNEAFVRRFFPGQNPLGREVKRGNSGPYRVVGVVSDSIYRSARQGPVPTMFLPVAQGNGSGPQIALTVRAAAGQPASLTRGLTTALGGVSANMAFTFRPMSDQTRTSLNQERLVATLAGAFGVLALVLAAVGLYGITAYGVNRRRGEIGIRMALGAAPGRVVRLVLQRVGWLVISGVGLGIVASLWASKYVAASLLFATEPRDPATLVLAVVVLVAVALFAGWLPARRASHIDPVSVLRES